MSAWVAPKDHVDLVVTAIMGAGVVDPDTGEPFTDGTALGRELWGENVASVKYRYEDSMPRNERRAYDIAVREYEYEPCPEPVGDWEPGEVVGAAVRSLIYQSCEHAGWEASRSCRVLEQMGERTPWTGPGSRSSMLGWHFWREEAAA